MSDENINVKVSVDAKSQEEAGSNIAQFIVDQVDARRGVAEARENAKAALRKLRGSRLLITVDPDRQGIVKGHDIRVELEDADGTCQSLTSKMFIKSLKWEVDGPAEVARCTMVVNDVAIPAGTEVDRVVRASEEKLVEQNLALIEQVATLKAALTALVQGAVWTSGAPCFQKGQEAHEAFHALVSPAIDQAMGFLRS